MAKPYVNREPPIWFHEVFRTDGTPDKPAEIDLIRGLTGRDCKKESSLNTGSI